MAPAALEPTTPYIHTYIHTYLRIYAHMYVCKYIVCMHVCMYVCMYVCIYLCTHVCIHLCMYICKYVCVYVYKFVYVRMYICANVLYYPGARGGSLATSCTPHLTICLHSCTFVWSSYNIGTEGCVTECSVCAVCKETTAGVR